MTNFRNTYLAASLFVLGCFLLIGGRLSAGEKKETPKAALLLSKAEELTDDDEKDTHPALKNSPRKTYKIKLAAGKTYQIDLKSKAFDAVLRLEDSAGKEVAFNDDFNPGASLDSRIVYAATKAGEYTIIATCLDGKTGKFNLTVAAGPAAGQVASMFKGKAVKLEFKDGKATYAGELSDQDGAVRNHYYKIFTIELAGGKTYRIEYLDAGDDPKFDPFLFLESADGKTLAQDDDSAGGLNARIIYKAEKTGVYRIVTTTLPTNQTGKFRLEITPGTADDIKEADLAESVAKYALSTPAEQKKTRGAVLNHFRDRGANLTIRDVQLAFQLTMATDNLDVEVARSTYKDCIKLFAAADNKQIAGVARNFESSLKKLDMIGKTIAIAGKTVDGKDFDLKDLKGKVVLVDFWATWCGPCIAEMPNIEKAFDKYHAKGFEVIGVSLDKSNAAITKFAEARKMKWGSINIEDSEALADKYDVNSIPFPVLVDQAGNVVSIRASGPQLEILLERLLGERK